MINEKEKLYTIEFLFFFSSGLVYQWLAIGRWFFPGTTVKIKLNATIY